MFPDISLLCLGASYDVMMLRIYKININFKMAFKNGFRLKKKSNNDSKLI